MRQSTTTKLITIGTSISFCFLKNMLSSIDFGTGSSESFKEYVFNWIITDVFEKFHDLIDSSYLNIDEKEEVSDKYNVKVTSYRTYEYINSSSVDMGMYPCVVKGINFVRRILGLSYSIYFDCLVCLKTSCTCPDEAQSLINVLEDLIKYIALNSVYDPTVYNSNEVGDFVLLDDFYVDLESQQAKGYKMQ